HLGFLGLTTRIGSIDVARHSDLDQPFHNRPGKRHHDYNRGNRERHQFQALGGKQEPHEKKGHQSEEPASGTRLHHVEQGEEKLSRSQNLSEFRLLQKQIESERESANQRERKFVRAAKKQAVRYVKSPGLVALPIKRAADEQSIDTDDVDGHQKSAIPQRHSKRRHVKKYKESSRNIRRKKIGTFASPDAERRRHNQADDETKPRRAD